MKDPALLPIIDERVLAAFAAMILGSSPLDPNPEACEIATLAARLAERRPATEPGADATRAFRSVYRLARDRQGPPPDPYRADRSCATRAWIVLEATLDLRHRQRAALALRYVFGLPPAGVAGVLGLSRARAAEVVRAGSINVAKACGGRIDVARHLRSIGAVVVTEAGAVPAFEAWRQAREPRSVVRLLLAPATEDRETDRASPASEAAGARPVYGVSPPAASAPSPPVLPARRRRAGLALAACIAALTFLGAFLPASMVRPTARPPLAAVGIVPASRPAPAVRVPAAPAVPRVYLVRQGDTLWSIAGTQLGDAARWPELWRANAGEAMTDGARFVDPDLIRPGWRLKLPR